MEEKEKFSESQEKILKKYVSNTTENVFFLKNLPEVVKGALFSRYSRSSLGLRKLLLKEFILNEDSSFPLSEDSLSENIEDKQEIAVQKAKDFYNRILDGYGDDSIGELGGVHLAFENISLLACKEIEDIRLGGSFLEKSTRYIYFDKKVNEKYMFYEEPILMTSAYKDKYLETCNFLFDTYSKLSPILTKKIEATFPKEHHISKIAYNAALKAKVLDCLRGLLPTSSLTNVGVFGNGRFFENLIKKLSTHNLAELQSLGKSSFDELSKIIFSFIKRAEPSTKYFQAYSRFKENTKEGFLKIASKGIDIEKTETEYKVKLISFDKEAIYKVASSLLFEFTNNSLEDLFLYSKELNKEEILRIFEVASMFRENRRHKSPRGLELAEFTFEIVADFGIYRDLQRHRILTQKRQLLTCDLGYVIPIEIIKTEMEAPYIEAMEKAKNTYDLISKEFPEEAQYVVPMAYNMRWFFHVNLRALQWLCELRSSPAGHPGYRFIAQEMVKKVLEKFPEFEKFFRYVDFDGHELGRLNQEIKTEKKKQTFL